MCTACGNRMAHRKWIETKQLPSMLPGPAVPGCSLVPFHFLWAIIYLQAVYCLSPLSLQNLYCLSANFLHFLTPPRLQTSYIYGSPLSQHFLFRSRQQNNVHLCMLVNLCTQGGVFRHDDVDLGRPAHRGRRRVRLQSVLAEQRKDL